MAQSGPRRNQYFVPGDGIAREVIQADICKYLDNDAMVKPGEYQGRQGYLIYAYRNLTSEMIRDLQTDSAKWENERLENQKKQPRHQPRTDVSSYPYVESQVHYERQLYGPSVPDSASRPPPSGGRGGGPSNVPIGPGPGPGNMPPGPERSGPSPYDESGSYIHSPPYAGRGGPPGTSGYGSQGYGPSESYDQQKPRNMGPPYNDRGWNERERRGDDRGHGAGFDPMDYDDVPYPNAPSQGHRGGPAPTGYGGSGRGTQAFPPQTVHPPSDPSYPGDYGRQDTSRPSNSRPGAGAGGGDYSNYPPDNRRRRGQGQ